MINENELVQFILEKKILTFGEFLTKSGRKSPYFCNFGNISKTSDLKKLSSFYSDLIIKSFGSKVDNVFGPSYKGIALSIMVADSLSQKLGKDVSFTFNRKEAKDHGEKGIFVGHQYNGNENIVIVEDVITSGISLLESFNLLKSYKLKSLGAVVCIDREESYLDSKEKARASLENEIKKPIKSLLSISSLFKILISEQKIKDKFPLNQNEIQNIKNYQENYC